MSQENVEIAREGFRRFQASDAGWIDSLDPEVGWDISAHPLPDVPKRGRGREELLTQVFATYLGGWVDWRAELREAIDAGDDVVLVLRETARLRDSGAVLDREVAYVWTMRDERVVFLRVFRTKAAAFEALGLAE